MDENNIVKKKKKNYYRQNHYYDHKKHYYKHKKKKNLVLDNGEDVANILLNDNVKEEPKPIVQVIKENIPDYEEEEIVLKKKDKKNSGIFKNNVLKYSLGIALIFVIVASGSYAFFNYTRVDSRQANVTAGEVYIQVDENPINIDFSGMYPMLDEEAREKNDNYIDFTIKGKNTSTSRPILYSIVIEDGEDVLGKTRIDPQYIKVDLQEKINDEYVYIKSGISLSDFVFNSTIPINTTNELLKEYRIRLWMGDNLIVNDFDTNASYTEEEFSNLFATYNVKVDSHDVE